MTDPMINQLVAAWTSWAARHGERDDRHRVALRLLADGAPVAASRIAQATGQTVHEANGWLQQMHAAGYELDDEGRLVGAALTLRPTAHRFRVRGNGLYAWCGFDTLLLPILLNEPAEISATCPATGQPIRLEVAADGTVTRTQPAGTVIAVVGPQVLATGGAVGPASHTCEEMPLLTNAEAAHQWVQDRPGVLIVELDTAVELARTYVAAGCC